MRPIKFRVWDNKLKEFLNAEEHFSNRCLFTPDDESRGMFVNASFEFAPEIKDDDLILLQFTGLKDKNGKEIYEGDIVKGINLENFYWIEPVTFIDNGWHPFIGHRAIEDYEVIGNIYENKDLLK